MITCQRHANQIRFGPVFPQPSTLHTLDDTPTMEASVTCEGQIRGISGTLVWRPPERPVHGMGSTIGGPHRAWRDMILVAVSSNAEHMNDERRSRIGV